MRCLHDEAYLWAIKNESTIAYVCKQACRGRIDLLEEMHSFCISELPRIWKAWIPAAGAALPTYIVRALSNNLRRWMYVNHRHLLLCEENVYANQNVQWDYDDAPEDLEANGAKLQLLARIRSHLSDDENWYLDAKFVCKWTFREIAEHVGINLKCAVKRVKDAQEAARVIGLKLHAQQLASANTRTKFEDADIATLTLEELRAVLPHLKDDEKWYLEARFVCKWSYLEIAQALSIKVVHAQKFVHDAVLVARELNEALHG